MTSITEIRGAAGEEWYSWPAGSTDAVLAKAYAGQAGDVTAISDAIESLDLELVKRGAAFGGVWVPPSLHGQVAATFWAGVIVAPADTFRSALRFERTVSDPASESSATVFAKNVESSHLNDTEIVTQFESRADGDDTSPYYLARVAYFPTWTKNRVVFEATCPALGLRDEFARQAGRIAGSITFTSNQTPKE